MIFASAPRSSKSVLETDKQPPSAASRSHCYSKRKLPCFCPQIKQSEGGELKILKGIALCKRQTCHLSSHCKLSELPQSDLGWKHRSLSADEFLDSQSHKVAKDTLRRSLRKFDRFYARS